jgi:hypothetical protein
MNEQRIGGSGESRNDSTRGGRKVSRKLVLLIVVLVLIGSLPLALPVVIFLVKVGWPRLREEFRPGLEDLEQERPPKQKR